MSEQTFFAELFDRVFYEQHPLVIETMILCREPALGPSCRPWRCTTGCGGESCRPVVAFVATRLVR